MRKPNLQQPGVDERGFHKTIKLSTAQVQAVLESLDYHDRNNPARAKRANPRVPYRLDSDLELTVTHPGGGVGYFQVIPVNLSAGGMCFLHGGFLYPGSACSLQLRMLDNSPGVQVTGTVVWCQHCSGNCHAVGIKFETPIDIRPFVDIDQMAGVLAKLQMFDPAALTGRVVAIEREAIDAELMEVVMVDTGIDYSAVRDVAAALEVLKTEPVDLILCELNLGEARGEEAIAEIRASGFRRPIIAVTSVTDPARLAAATSAGANDIVRKPFDTQAFLHVLDHFLSGLKLKVDRRPLTTTLDPNIAAKRRVPSYIARVAEAGTNLDAAARGGDLQTSRSVCQSLLVSADAYGFPLLAEAARTALAALDASQSVEESRDDLFRVAMVVQRIVLGGTPPAPQMVA